jgi:mono/diheme cytochrome c family protein
VSLALTPACGIRKAMYDQPKYEAYQKSDFFGDARSSRPLLEGTVARGQLYDDAHLYEGKVDGQQATTFPFPVTREVLQRGQERYNIYCSPCHDQAGTGRGMVVQRGFKQPPAYTDPRLLGSPPGYFFEVMTKGFGQMSGYAGQVKPEDRWAIAAYIRVLQLSQHATIEDVPVAERSQLQKQKTESHGTPGHT